MYNPKEIEENILKFWEENKIFNKLREKNKNGKKFRFIDGPITANYPMGVHHAYGRTLKDAYQRYRALQGFNQRYQNGFDCHGLPVEVTVEKELNLNTKKDIEAYGIENFTKKCKDRVIEMSKVLTKQSIRLGQWMDWDNSYYTMSDNNIVHIWHLLKKCHENGWLYKGHRVQPWCIRCGTSLSQHEVGDGYQILTHTAVFLKFKLEGKENEYIMVWTTTPWTLTSNVAAAVGPDVTYVKAKKAGEILYISKATSGALGQHEVLGEIKGKDMIGWKYSGPYDELEAQKGVIHKIVPWDLVGESDGTGIVHIAPGCGAEDFELGQKLKLPAVAPLDESGNYIEGFGWLTGKNVTEVLNPILEDLDNKGILYRKDKITHSYPTCWRCKQELVFRMTDAWFIKTDEIRDKMIEQSNKVFWSPELGGKLMVDWLNNMRDWNISRKRYWGLPLPFWVCECGEVTVVGSREELEKIAVSGMDKLKDLHKPQIDNVLVKCKCGKHAKRTDEVGDCWLDAGIVPYSTLNYMTDKDYWKEWFPAEFISEMREQVRLWFYSLLFMSVALEEKTPYEKVLLFEKVYDENGEEMHKSGKNVIWFDDAIEKMGADVMRWMYVKTNLTQNVMFGYSPAKIINRKLNYLLDITTYIQNSFTKRESELPDEIEDRWILSKLESVKKKVHVNMEELKPHIASAILEDFIIEDLSRTYIQIIRNRMKGDEANKVTNLLYNIMLDVLKMMSPYTPFITEHIYQDFFRKHENKESVHLLEWPFSNHKLIDEELEKQMMIVQKMVEAVNFDRQEKKIKLKYILPKLTVSGNDDVKKTVKSLNELITKMANVKDVEFGEISSGYSVKLNYKVAGKKFGRDIKKVEEFLKKEDAAKLKNKETVILGSFELEQDDMIFTTEGEGKQFDGGMIMLDTKVTDELKKEWLLRELIRAVQATRKEMGLEVKDRIKLYLPKEFKGSEETIEESTGSKIIFENKFNNSFEFEEENHEFGVEI